MEERSKESSALVLPKALPKTTMEWDSDEEASSSELAFMGRSLSEDLLLTVLSKLPLESLRRFRCVCRKWNDLLMSWEFSRSICHKPGKLIPLYPGDGELNLYDTSNRCWLQRDLKFGDDQGLLIEDQGYELVASGGGLLAFLAKPQLDANWRERFPTFIVSNPLTRQSHRERFPTFIVSNPLTRQYHRLPTSVVHGSRSLNIPEVGHLLCGIDVDLETGYYTFLFLDTRSIEGEGETYVYDSKLCSWRISHLVHLPWLPWRNLPRMLELCKTISINSEIVQKALKSFKKRSNPTNTRSFYALSCVALLKRPAAS
ncbi:hypothetical protein MPTK1_2g03480 [Marchantia polymorpha subsp. ruderalis]|uniref:F-box domain-containing protein n=1 Tax=Marchantia polymorpha TaxID=3197 RepID=A0A2R6X7D6_MARPO|nr:hypothetical protein MARPO_0031s0004 [Marchantia polymorpha]BBN00964.1 hypothetical protein Mp_2g03480 [Marchantia polymorpha subsp. ruderalis]|eukprot:PTQ42012.1 hypothetical protein MARPO_0031s0004 [Marchantia polymorpha]